MKKLLLLFVVAFAGNSPLACAERAKCPDANTIKHAIVPGQYGYNVHQYTGTSTGGRKIIFTNRDDRDTDPLRQPQDPAEVNSLGTQLSCLYDNLTLTTRDAGATKDCRDIPGTSNFECQ